MVVQPCPPQRPRLLLGPYLRHLRTCRPPRPCPQSRRVLTQKRPPPLRSCPAYQHPPPSTRHPAAAPGSSSPISSRGQTPAVKTASALSSLSGARGSAQLGPRQRLQSAARK